MAFPTAGRSRMKPILLRCLPVRSMPRISTKINCICLIYFVMDSCHDGCAAPGFQAERAVSRLQRKFRRPAAAGRGCPAALILFFYSASLSCQSPLRPIVFLLTAVCCTFLLTAAAIFSIFMPANFGGWSNGKTADSDSAYRGSNPCPPAMLPASKAVRLPLFLPVV